MQLDRKEFFRQQEQDKRMLAELQQDSQFPFQPMKLSRGLCDCCGKLRCNYKMQLFLDNVREGEFKQHGRIKGYDQTVSRMRRGLLEKFSKETLYRR